MESFDTTGIVYLLTFPQNLLIICLSLLVLTFLWRTTALALRKRYNLRESQVNERVDSLPGEKCDSRVKIMEQNFTIEELKDQLNVYMQFSHSLQKENNELKVTAKLFGEENGNMREKTKLFEKHISEKEQRITNLNDMMASMEKDLLDKSMKIFALEKALIVERADTVRLRQRLVETTDLLVLLKKPNLAALPQLVDHHRSRSQKNNNSAIFKEILHELASEALGGLLNRVPEQTNPQLTPQP